MPRIDPLSCRAAKQGPFIYSNLKSGDAQPQQKAAAKPQMLVCGEIARVQVAVENPTVLPIVVSLSQSLLTEQRFHVSPALRGEDMRHRWRHNVMHSGELPSWIAEGAAWLSRQPRPTSKTRAFSWQWASGSGHQNCTGACTC